MLEIEVGNIDFLRYTKRGEDGEAQLKGICMLKKSEIWQMALPMNNFRV